jgi:hypothetical protein
MEHQHIGRNDFVEYILRKMDNGEYFPLTKYRCSICGEEFVSDGIWWVIQGIPPNTIFEPEPEGDEIIIDIVIGKIRSSKVKI